MCKEAPAHIPLYKTIQVCKLMSCDVKQGYLQLCKYKEG